MEIKIYVANLSAYNNGHLVGEWLTLPLDTDELQERIDAILNAWNDGLTPSEECAIHDYEAPFTINEYDSISKLNEYAELLENVDHLDESIVEAIIGNFSNVQEGFDIIENEQFIIHSNCNSMSDVAYDQYEDNGQLAELEKVIPHYYIDWEAIGRDMEINGTFLKAGNAYIEITR